VIGSLAQLAGLDRSEVRLALTAAVFAGLVVGWMLVRRVSDRLRGRYDEGRVETVEMSVLTLLVGATAVAIVVVWDAVTEMRTQLESFEAEPETGVTIVVSLLIVAVAYGVVRTARRVIRSSAGEGTTTDHRREVAYHVTQVAVYVLAGMVVLTLWGVQLGNLLVGAGFLGVVLGLAARQTLGAVLAGFVLLFSRPFTVGDWVTIDDQEGVITDVTIVNTQLRTLDDEYVMIPNDRVTGEAIVNHSRGDQLRVTVEVGVDYDADPDRAADVATAAMDDCDGTLDSPAPHVVGKRFGDSSVVLELRFWIDDPSARRMWRARTEVVSAVKAAFEREGIDIPFPQRTLGGRDSRPIPLGTGERAGAASDGAGDDAGGDRDAARADGRGDGGEGEDDAGSPADGEGEGDGDGGRADADPGEPE
jgi:small-conductance mechanosensitive channel